MGLVGRLGHALAALRAFDWSRHIQFWRATPATSYAIFIAGVFLMFVPVGILRDISNLGSDPPSRLIAETVNSGGLTVAYVVAFRRPRWLLAVIASPILILPHVELLFPPLTAPLAGEALRARLQADANIVIVTLIASFLAFSLFVRREGSRYVRASTEIALARDIHRLLVPPIGRRVGSFEFRGTSVPSGDVGGDLIDLVETDGRWIGYVADVSGHGVGAGLLMGMVKSAA